jgi:hypothetical protein
VARHDDPIPTDLSDLLVSVTRSGEAPADQSFASGGTLLQTQIRDKQYRFNLMDRSQRGTGAPRPVLLLQLCTACPQAHGNRSATKHERETGLLAPRHASVAPTLTSQSPGARSTRSPGPRCRAPGNSRPGLVPSPLRQADHEAATLFAQSARQSHPWEVPPDEDALA